MADIVMPRLSDTMEEGTILRWLKRDGEQLARGEELVEIETDKATMTYESDQDGVLEIVAAEGDTLPVGELIARVGVAARAGAAAPEAPTPAQAGGAPPPQGADGKTTPATVGVAGDGPARAPAEAAARSAPAEGREAAGAGRVRASPLARRIARENGIDLRTLAGSGPGGRIVRADVLAHEPAPAATGAGSQASRGSPAAPAPEASLEEASLEERVATAKGETTIVELNRTQQTIARRMAESKATIPDFTLQSEVDMDECVRLRTELKRLSRPGAPSEHGSGAPEVPTYNDMVVKACALALREHPRANGSYKDGHLELHARINIGVAVAAHDALIVPTVFDADEKSLGEIARETRALAERVRAGTITPPELGGGTFTVSNLGMYGVRSFSAIINPPQAAILSVGSLEPRAVVREGQLGSAHTMALTLACDHRILYGADAAQLLSRIRELLQQPAALTL
ncbi:MAG TPA: dihydrolipoamide acetyltransferase family protein [Solirubrobacteraceae bacterium]|jgi:pyruvate dehydrogenase E2 component (dihydrolipoamide acetyltransferase)|nr:dihydrolipoamide acetyltransferase family protein [Solirubrobacteraceae bacterium]